jgi:serine/threonine-protein kinase
LLWLSGTVFPVALLLGAVAVSQDVPREAAPREAPRGVLVHHHVTVQVIFSQEFATEDMTGEVGSSAGLQRSSTPALIAHAMHREVHPMFKSPKTRAAFIAVCLASSGCASGPKVRPPPPDEKCPPGAMDVHKSRSFQATNLLASLDLSDHLGRTRVVPVREGPITVRLLDGEGGIPEGTLISGQVFVATIGVYMRFTEARLPSGELLPVCLDADASGKGYVRYESGSSAERPLVRSVVHLGTPLGFYFH